MPSTRRRDALSCPRLVSLAILVLALVAGRARADDGPSAAQRASIFAKGSVVRVLGYWEVTFALGRDPIVQYVGGTGSGFFASGDGFVVTNAHVIADIQGGPDKAKAAAYAQLAHELTTKYASELGRLSDAELAAFGRSLRDSAVAKPTALIVLPDGTKVPYEIKVAGTPGEGTDVAILKVELKDVPNLPIADSAKAQIQDKVLAIGYPGAADMKGLLDDKSQLEATINEGAISAIKRTSSGDPILQISASITHGNSGGPAINDRGEVIGLSTFGSRGEVQGFNFLVASSTVTSFLAKAKVDLTPSPTTRVWRHGLEALWSLDLDVAIADFEEVMTLFPAHSEAPRMAQQARALKKEGKGKPAAPPPAPAKAPAPDSSAGGIVAAFVLLGLIGIGVVALVRRAKRRGALPSTAMPPSAVPPGAMPPSAIPPSAMPPSAMMVPPSRAAQPVARTVAIAAAPGGAPVAKTSLGGLHIGVLTCTRGRLQGQRFALTPQGLLIGRQPGLAQIVIDDPRSSGKHVWIGYEQGALVAIDQGTTNGTFINDVRHGRISKAVLRHGDTVIVSEPDCLSLTVELA